VGVIWAEAMVGSLGVNHDKGEKRLEVPCRAEMEDGEMTSLRILIDTGAEVNLIRRGIIPDQFLTPLTVHGDWLQPINKSLGEVTSRLTWFCT